MNRQVFALAAVVVLVATSGCLSVLTGGDLSFEAQSALIENETASELEYRLVRNNATTASRTFEVFGQEREVRLRTWQAVYTRITAPNMTAEERAEMANASEEERRQMMNESAGASAVIVVSTPDAQVAGQSVSPLSRLSARQLIENFGSGSAGSASDLEFVEARDVEMLGSETNLSVFRGTTRNETTGTSQQSRLYVAKTPHEGDVVVVIATHPAGLEGASDRIETVVQNIDHPTDRRPMGAAPGTSEGQ